MIVDKYGRVAGSIDLATLAQMYAECDDDDLREHYSEVAAEHGIDLGSSPALFEPEMAGEPPRSGPGSGKDAWLTYAESLGIKITDDMTRDDIIAACEEE